MGGFSRSADEASRALERARWRGSAAAHAAGRLPDLARANHAAAREVSAGKMARARRGVSRLTTARAAASRSGESDRRTRCRAFRTRRAARWRGPRFRQKPAQRGPRDEPALRSRKHAEPDRRDGRPPPRAASERNRGLCPRARRGRAESRGSRRILGRRRSRAISRRNRGGGLVVAGEFQPPEVHAHRARAQRDARETSAPRSNTRRRCRAAIPSRTSRRRCARGKWRRCSFSAAIPFTTRLRTSILPAHSQKVPFTVAHSLYPDETAERCLWHVPQSHFLESWSDVRAGDGSVSIVQPLIAPLYPSQSPHELLAALLGELPTDGLRNRARQLAAASR